MCQAFGARAKRPGLALLEPEEEAVCVGGGIGATPAAELRGSIALARSGLLQEVGAQSVSAAPHQPSEAKLSTVTEVLSPGHRGPGVRSLGARSCSLLLPTLQGEQLGQTDFFPCLFL